MQEDIHFNVVKCKIMQIKDINDNIKYIPNAGSTAREC